jgi:protein TonB
MICEGWEGLTVDGRFPLLEWLRGWADRCVFLTVRKGTQKANIKLVIAGGAEAEALLARWESAKALAHASLVQMMETGRYKINGADVVFVLTEKTDAILSGIIPRRALDAGRMKAILGPVVDALAFLHEKGMAHGCVKPSRIVQVGNQWKLVSDEIVGADVFANKTRELDTFDAPELTAGRLTPASDLWSLGIIIIEAFAQRTPVWDRTANGDLGVPNFIPEPFRGIARDCLRWEREKRISISEMKTRLANVKAVAVDEPAKVNEPGPIEPVVAEQVKQPAEPAAINQGGAKLDVKEEPANSPEGAAGPLFAAVAATSSVERHTAPVEESWKDSLTSPPEQESVAPRSLFGQEEPAELTPRSRMFASIEEREPEGRSWTSVIVVLVLIAAGAAGVHYRTEIRTAVESRMGSATSRNQPSQTQTPQAESPAQSSTQPVSPSQPPPQTQSQATPPGDSSAAPGEPATQKPPAPEAKSTPPATEPAPKEEALPSVSKSGAAQQPATEAPKHEAQPKQAEQAPRAANGKGAVLNRVMPNVAPGASQGMRGPVEVELRVSVDENGRVSNAEYLTKGPGNYFARVAHDAARSWKFKAPVSDGEARESEWILLFKFGRGHTDVTASEVR